MSGNIDAITQAFEEIFERALDRVLERRNAVLPSVDPELAAQIARINAKPNITVAEAALLLNCSESHLYVKIKAAKKKKPDCPIPFYDLDGVYVLPREALLEWAAQKKEQKPLKGSARK
jgi:hypothetical protein